MFSAHPNLLAAPDGQTCGDYAGAFAQAVGGYINNPGSTGDCQFCQYSVGDSFYRNLNITYDTRWRDFGIFVSTPTLFKRSLTDMLSCVTPSSTFSYFSLPPDS
jgi:hypothetical protein